MQTIYLDRKEIITKIIDGNSSNGEYVLAVAPDGSEARVCWANRGRPWNEWPADWLTTPLPSIHPEGSGREGDDALDMLTACLSPEAMAEAQRRHDDDEERWVVLAEELVPDDWAEGKASYAGDLADEWLWALNGAPARLDVQWGGHATEEGWEPNEAPAEFEWEHKRAIPLPDAATYAGVAYATMAEAVREGRVQARRVGRARGIWLTTRAAVDQAIDEGKLRPRK